MTVRCRATSAPATTHPVLPGFLHAYVQHVCPLKRTTLVRDHLGMSCLDDLVVPPLMDQASITATVDNVPPSTRGLVMYLLLRGDLDRAAFVIRNADTVELVHDMFQEVMRSSESASVFWDRTVQ